MILLYYKKLIGKKCYLSPICVDDYKQYTNWINDMEVAINVGFVNRIMTEDQEKKSLESIVLNNKDFAIVDCENDKLIGNIGFVNLDYTNALGEMGLFIGDKSFWGQGYGLEAINLLLDYGFNICNLHCIYLRVYEFNMQAYKCYKKAGFKEAGRIRQAKQIAGTKYDEIYMDILTSEYESIYIKKLLNKKLKA